MEDFPTFETLMSSPDVKRELKRHFDLQNAHKEQVATSFGINIVIDRTLPPCSALFIDHKKRIVAIYRDGELVYLSQRKHKKPRKRGR